MSKDLSSLQEFLVMHKLLTAGIEAHLLVLLTVPSTKYKMGIGEGTEEMATHCGTQIISVVEEVFTGSCWKIPAS